MSGQWLLRLYPRSWRARYGEEFLHLLASQAMSIGVIVDVLAGAIDAWLSPQPQIAPGGARREGANVMKLLILRCGDARTLSRGEQWQAALTFAAVTVGLSLAYVGVNRLFGHNLYLEAAGIAVFPIALMAATVPAYLRGHSMIARVVLTTALSVLVYLGALLAAWT